MERHAVGRAAAARHVRDRLRHVLYALERPRPYRDLLAIDRDVVSDPYLYLVVSPGPDLRQLYGHAGRLRCELDSSAGAEVGSIDGHRPRSSPCVRRRSHGEQLWLQLLHPAGRHGAELRAWRFDARHDARRRRVSGYEHVRPGLEVRRFRPVVRVVVEIGPSRLAGIVSDEPIDVRTRLPR